MTPQNFGKGGTGNTSGKGAEEGAQLLYVDIQEENADTGITSDHGFKVGMF